MQDIKTSVSAKMNVKELGSPMNEFTEVSLDGKTQKKLPRRRVYFSDGYLDEYSTEEDEEEKTASQSLIDTTNLPWLPYLWHVTWWVGTKALAVCDYLGENLAYYLGITTPKFQYEIEQYEKMIEEEETLKKQIEAENSGWTEKAPDEVLLHLVANEPVSTKVVVSSSDKVDSAKESTAGLSGNDSRKWQRY